MQLLFLVYVPPAWPVSLRMTEAGVDDFNQWMVMNILKLIAQRKELMIFVPPYLQPLVDQLQPSLSGYMGDAVMRSSETCAQSKRIL